MKQSYKTPQQEQEQEQEERKKLQEKREKLQKDLKSLNNDFFNRTKKKLGSSTASKFKKTIAAINRMDGDVEREGKFSITLKSYTTIIKHTIMSDVSSVDNTGSNKMVAIRALKNILVLIKAHDNSHKSSSNKQVLISIFITLIKEAKGVMRLHLRGVFEEIRHMDAELNCLYCQAQFPPEFVDSFSRIAPIETSNQFLKQAREEMEITDEKVINIFSALDAVEGIITEFIFFKLRDSESSKNAFVTAYEPITINDALVKSKDLSLSEKDESLLDELLSLLKKINDCGSEEFVKVKVMKLYEIALTIRGYVTHNVENALNKIISNCIKLESSELILDELHAIIVLSRIGEKHMHRLVNLNKFEEACQKFSESDLIATRPILLLLHALFSENKFHQNKRKTFFGFFRSKKHSSVERGRDEELPVVVKAYDRVIGSLDLNLDSSHWVLLFAALVQQIKISSPNVAEGIKQIAIEHMSCLSNEENHPDMVFVKFYCALSLQSCQISNGYTIIANLLKDLDFVAASNAIAELFSNSHLIHNISLLLNNADEQQKPFNESMRMFLVACVIERYHVDEGQLKDLKDMLSLICNSLNAGNPNRSFSQIKESMKKLANSGQKNVDQDTTRVYQNAAKILDNIEFKQLTNSSPLSLPHDDATKTEATKYGGVPISQHGQKTQSHGYSSTSSSSVADSRKGEDTYYPAPPSWPLTQGQRQQGMHDSSHAGVNQEPDSAGPPVPGYHLSGTSSPNQQGDSEVYHEKFEPLTSSSSASLPHEGAAYGNVPISEYRQETQSHGYSSTSSSSVADSRKGEDTYYPAPPSWSLTQGQRQQGMYDSSHAGVDQGPDSAGPFVSGYHLSESSSPSGQGADPLYPRVGMEELDPPLPVRDPGPVATASPRLFPRPPEEQSLQEKLREPEEAEMASEDELDSLNNFDMYG